MLGTGSGYWYWIPDLFWVLDLDLVLGKGNGADSRFWVSAGKGSDLIVHTANKGYSFFEAVVVVTRIDSFYFNLRTKSCTIRTNI